MNDNHAFYSRRIFEVIESKVVKHADFPKINNEFDTWYCKQYDWVRTMTYQGKKELIFDMYIHVCPEWSTMIDITPYSTAKHKGK